MWKYIIAVYEADCPWVVEIYEKKFKQYKKMFPDAFIEFNKEPIARETDGKVYTILVNIGRIYTYNKISMPLI